MAEMKRRQRRPSWNLGHLATVLQDTVGGSMANARFGVRAVFDEILRATLAGEAITIQRFGRFEGVIRKARVGRNPRTGEPLDLPSARVLVFRRVKTAVAEVLDEGKVKRPKKK